MNEFYKSLGLTGDVKTSWSVVAEGRTFYCTHGGGRCTVTILNVLDDMFTLTQGCGFLLKVVDEMTGDINGNVLYDIFGDGKAIHADEYGFFPASDAEQERLLSYFNINPTKRMAIADVLLLDCGCDEWLHYHAYLALTSSKDWILTSLRKKTKYGWAHDTDGIMDAKEVRSLLTNKAREVWAEEQPRFNLPEFTE